MRLEPDDINDDRQYSDYQKQIMEKNIKDYLHLYLGSKIDTSLNGTTLNGYWYDRIMNDECDANLILRPLSDMTEEEQKEWQNIRFNSEFKLKPVLTDAEYESFRYLLSKHFDLFGLMSQHK